MASTGRPLSTSVPATSSPGTNGGGGDAAYRPRVERVSAKLTPALWTRIRT